MRRCSSRTSPSASSPEWEDSQGAAGEDKPTRKKRKSSCCKAAKAADPLSLPAAASYDDGTLPCGFEAGSAWVDFGPVGLDRVLEVGLRIFSSCSFLSVLLRLCAPTHFSCSSACLRRLTFRDLAHVEIARACFRLS